MKRMVLPLALLLLISSCNEAQKPAPVTAQTVATTRNPVTVQPAMSSLAQTPALVSQPVKTAPEKEQAAKIFSPDRLPKQRFTVSTKKDTIIKGMEGTRLFIPADAFVTLSGKPVKGSVNIELKEALTRLDMALGNLTTVTSGGKFLESGGMIYVNATANGEQLALADSKTIGADVPATDRKNGMSLWEGENSEEGNLSWTNPVPIEGGASEIVKVDSVWQEFEINNITNRAERMAWRVSGISPGMPGWTALQNDVDNNYQGKLDRDTTIRIRGYDVHFFSTYKKTPAVATADNASKGYWIKTIDGVNSFLTDNKLNYVFRMTNLGWANIDRCLADPRTRTVKMKTVISNAADFALVYISLIMKDQNAFIPGYRKKDGSYSFSHNDIEEPALPVGDGALILATAYKDGKTFYALKPIVITGSQTVEFKLEETTDGALKTLLAQKL